MPSVGCDVCIVFHQVGFVLVGLTTEKSKEMFKALTTWPAVKRTGICRILIRCETILADGKRIIAITLKDLRNRPRRGGNAAVISRKASRHRDVRESAFMHKVTVTPRQQSRTRRSADSRSMKVGIPKAIVGQTVQRRSPDDTAKAADGAKADVIEEDPYNIRCVCRSAGRLGPPFF